MTVSTVTQENIYNLNFSDNQIQFLRKSKISSEPMLMKAIALTYLQVKKPGCYTGSEQIEISPGERFSVSKDRSYVTIKCERLSDCFIVKMRWVEYLEFKRKKTFVPIAVFTIN